jgi:hypothetical protein
VPIERPLVGADRTVLGGILEARLTDWKWQRKLKFVNG